MVTALALALPALCSGQGLPDPTRLEIDRAELTRLLAQYDAVAESTAYGDELRQEGRALADIIRERLRSGDFRSGDQIALLIEGAETVRWDTLTVEAGHLINVPTLGPILLQGVLRSELETHLSTEIGRFIQSPRIRAHSLIRVSVLGVGQPGFYTLPTDLPLSEAVMMVGGPGAGAAPDEIRIERGQDVLWSVEELQIPVSAGRTLDELGLQAGDRIILPGAAATGAASSAIMGQVIQSTIYVLIALLLGTSIG